MLKYENDFSLSAGKRTVGNSIQTETVAKNVLSCHVC